MYIYIFLSFSSNLIHLDKFFYFNFIRWPHSSLMTRLKVPRMFSTSISSVYEPKLDTMETAGFDFFIVCVCVKERSLYLTLFVLIDKKE